MSYLLIRWTHGEWIDQPNDPIMVRIQDVAVKLARITFPEARLVICYNNISSFTRDGLERTADETGCELIDAEQYGDFSMQPTGRDHKNDRNTWWKFMPLRLDNEAYELVLDNDLMIWREPLAMWLWRSDPNTILACADHSQYSTTAGFAGTIAQYGNYGPTVAAFDPTLKCGGMMLGFAPNIEFPIRYDETKLSPWRYGTEQGWSAANFAAFNGKKYNIPFKQIPSLDRNVVKPSELLTKCYGAHFTGHNIGRHTQYQTKYGHHIEEYLAKHSSLKQNHEKTGVFHIETLKDHEYQRETT